MATSATAIRIGGGIKDISERRCGKLESCGKCRHVKTDWVQFRHLWLVGTTLIFLCVLGEYSNQSTSNSATTFSNVGAQVGQKSNGSIPNLLRDKVDCLTGYISSQFIPEGLYLSGIVAGLAIILFGILWKKPS